MALQRNILEYLQASAARVPDKLAFSDEREKLTFSDVDKRAQALGTLIAGRTGMTNRPVAVLVERTAATLAAFMGALYSGNYYVPIDSQTPVKRIIGLLEQLDPLCLIHSDETRPLAEELSCSCPVLAMEEGFSTAPDNKLLDSRRGKVLDIDPVYVIFTSGSTGVPKGSVISHRSLIDFIEWMSGTLGFTGDDVMANQAPFFFDLSGKDIYLTLKCGATMHIIPRKLFMFPLMLLEFIDGNNITALVWATAAFRLVANSGALEKFAPKGLSKVMLGGEALHAKHLNIWRKALPDVRYVNLYGPTEATINCLYYVIDREYADHEAIPIGRACENTEILLLDEALRPVNSGETGEICVRGIGIARGYYGNPEKTAEVFVQNPNNPLYPDLIYRTGDMGFVNDEGHIVFASRRDGQIKHMSYRIELGEIEVALSALPELSEVVCFFDAERDKIICAYAGSLDADGIITGVRDILPKYMYPNIFRRMDKLPYTPGGKIDRVKIREDYFNESGRGQ
jgi:amino acid adenylation domain-containing protein